MKPSIGVLGTGLMGSALARAFIQARYPTTVWNRTKEKTEALGALGATVAASALDAVTAAEMIIVNVSDYAASAALLRSNAVAASVRGKLIVELTSGAPQGAREAARWAEAQGAGYLDGAILATPNFIGTEGGTILFSGARPVFDKNKEILGALGGNVQHVGEDPGIANALDSALLSLMWGALFGTLHAIAVCQAERIDLGELAGQWTATAPVLQGLVANLIERTKAARFAGDQESLSLISAHYGAFHHLLELTEAHKIDRAAIEAYDAIFKRAIAAGHLHDDFSALAQFTQRPV